MSKRHTAALAIRSGPIGLVLALGLSLALASQALGATWNPRVALSTSTNGQAGGLATLGSSTAVALYTEGPGIFVRRSTNSGATWKPRQNLGTTGLWNAIAGSGTDVDVVWLNEDPTTGETVRYRHSTDSGVSFSAPIDLVTGVFQSDFYWPNIARYAGVVAAIWQDGQLGLIRVRVSIDGGASFGSVTTLATVSTSYGPRPVVAVGKGAIYVAYFVDDTHVSMRRSLDNGATWTPAVELAADAYPNDNLQAISLTASGSHAYLAYAASNGTSKWVRYRRTIDKGASWSTAVDLSSPSAYPSYHPVIALKSSVVRVVFYECKVSNCSSAAARYRQSSNGTTWTAPETVSPSSPVWADPYGVGYAGRVIVLYSAAHGTNPYTCACDVYIRTR